MSSKWFVESETERVILGEGTDDVQWVDIKAVLSVADQDRLGQLLFDIKIETGNPDSLSRGERRRRAKAGKNVEAQFKPSTVALLEVAIVDWSCLDKDNNKIPITTEWIGRLKPVHAAVIEEAIDINNPLEEPNTPQNSTMLLKEDQP